MLAKSILIERYSKLLQILDRWMSDLGVAQGDVRQYGLKLKVRMRGRALPRSMRSSSVTWKWQGRLVLCPQIQKIVRNVRFVNVQRRVVLERLKTITGERQR